MRLGEPWLRAPAAMSDCLHAAGRCLLSALFLWGALHFCANADAARAGLVAGAGYPSGGVGTALFWLAALLSAVGGLLLATNLRVGVGAAILGGLLVPATCKIVILCRFAPRPSR